MRTDSSRMSAMADPILNRLFSRRWSDQPMTAREIQHLADLELARGNTRRADALNWQAQSVREVAQ